MVVIEEALIVIDTDLDKGNIRVTYPDSVRNVLNAIKGNLNYVSEDK